MSLPRVLLVLTVTALTAFAVQKFLTGNVSAGQTIDFPEGQYIGEMHNGVPHGEGLFKRHDGRIYQGEFVFGRLEGLGSVNFPDGSTYKGTFRNGNPSDEGVFTTPDGTRYIGIFTNGKLTGSGRIVFVDGQSFEGEFVGGNPIGPGTCKDANDQPFSCQIQDGQIIR